MGQLKFIASVIVATTIIAPVFSTGCHPRPADSATGPSRESSLAFASAVAALEVLDVLHAQRMASNAAPTEAEYEWAKAFSARLHSLRDALEITRSWLEGQATDTDGRASMRAASELLQVLVDDLKSQGIAIPAAVDAGLSAAKYFI